MKHRIKEQGLYPLVVKFLQQNGYDVLVGVYPIFASRIEVDVLGYNIEKNEIVSVEVKTGYFKRALSQASLRLWFSDYVYLAFPVKYAYHIHRRKRRLLEELGLGLLAIDGSAKELLAARKSPKTLPWLKAEVFRKVEPYIRRQKKHSLAGND